MLPCRDRGQSVFALTSTHAHTHTYTKANKSTHENTPIFTIYATEYTNRDHSVGFLEDTPKPPVEEKNTQPAICLTRDLVAPTRFVLSLLGLLNIYSSSWSKSARCYGCWANTLLRPTVLCSLCVWAKPSSQHGVPIRFIWTLKYGCWCSGCVCVYLERVSHELLGSECVCICGWLINVSSLS